MSLLILGVNHHTAPIDVRENVAITDAMLTQELSELMTLNAIQEGLIVSTCNRTEVYCYVDDINTGTQSLLSWLNKFHPFNKQEIES